MIIKKINLIQNIGIFCDYKWNKKGQEDLATNLPDFTNINLFYGGNGFGKTTLSELLRSIELKKFTSDILQKSAGTGKFEIELDDGTKINHGNFQSNSLSLKVFNKNFVEENVFCTGGAKPIIILSKESKEAKDKFEEMQKINAGLDEQIKKINDEILINNEKLEGTLTNKARSIHDALSNISTYRSYNKSNIRKEINGEFVKSLLSQDGINKLRENLSYKHKENINQIINPFQSLDIENFCNRVNSVLETNVVNDSISELKKDISIENWVRAGLDINRDSKICLFCGSSIGDDRLKLLENHFNDDYEQTINSINLLIQEADSYKNKKIIYPEKNSFFDEFMGTYEGYKNTCDSVLSTFYSWFDDVISELEVKKEKINSSYSLQVNIYDINSINKQVGAINDLIKSHNEKNLNLDKEKEKIARTLELHYISEIYDEFVRETNKNKKLQEEQKSIVNKKIPDTDILEAKKLAEKHGIAIDIINKLITCILGRDEIKLQLLPDGYSMIREGKEFSPSEGERTVIALAYFISKLQEDGFDIKESTIVVDDPITSLDENILFNIYGLLSSFLSDAKQIFVITHHFSFFKMFVNKYNKSIKTGKNFCYKINNCWETDEKRFAYICPLEDELIKYESEYEFLFKQLSQFREDKRSNPEDVKIGEGYNLANMLRKLLEIFLSFYFPKGDFSQKLKMHLSEIKMVSDYDEIKSFVNMFSHDNIISNLSIMDLTVYKNAWSVIDKVLISIQKRNSAHFNAMNNS